MSAKYLREFRLVSVCLHVDLTAIVDPTINDKPPAISLTNVIPVAVGDATVSHTPSPNVVVSRPSTKRLSVKSFQTGPRVLTKSTAVGAVGSCSVLSRKTPQF